jgi:hypothetical protein
VCCHKNPVSIENTPQSNFQYLWNEFDANYSFFVLKKINWDSLYSVYYPQVNSETTDFDLFQILSSLLSNLKDGHAILETPLGKYSYHDWYSNYPRNFLGTNTIQQKLLSPLQSQANGYLKYGFFPDSIGYLYIGPYLLGESKDWDEGIERIVDSFTNTKAAIIDIRNNRGGNDALGQIICGRLTSTKRIYSYIKVRNGPSHTDFTDFYPLEIEPIGNKRYSKPIIVLTNRSCFSSAEGTILMFKSLPNVTVMGDTTGGGSANPAIKKMPNSWEFRVSRWIQYTANKSVFEGKGIAPDRVVSISAEDSSNGYDRILDSAHSYLQKIVHSGATP